MGVHDLDKYPEVKRLLGIPEDEPIFILRAQDVLYAGAIAAYNTLYDSAIFSSQSYDIGWDDSKIAFSEHLAACETNGRRWQRRNRDAVKIPD